MSKKYLAGACLGALMFASTPASAAVIFNLDNVKFSDGGMLTGTITTSDDLKTLIDYSLTTSANNSSFGVFPGTIYTLATAFQYDWSPDYGLVAFHKTRATLSVQFGSPLTLGGVDLSGFERVQTKTPPWPYRTISSGSLTSPVPEPATWAMMIIGFGAVGSMVRTSRGRNSLSVA